jgi:hypothetical protein
MNDTVLVEPVYFAIAAAIDRSDPAEAKRLLGLMVGDWRRNKDYSINWITSLLSFIGARLGEEAVEEALRDFGERYLKARRYSAETVVPRKRMEGIVRAMKANGGTAEVSEDAEKWSLSFRCGTGGKLIDEGAYSDGRAYLTLSGPSPVTFGRESLPAYCAHCSVNNEIQAIEWEGAPATVEFPPTAPGERCVHHVYKNASDIPAEIYERVGKIKPE